MPQIPAQHDGLLAGGLTMLAIGGRYDQPFDVGFGALLTIAGVVAAIGLRPAR